MNVRIQISHEERLVAIAAASGRSVDDVLDEALEKGLGQMTQPTSGSSAEAQRQAIEVLLAEIDSLPIGNPEDGFSAADHDVALYRRDW